LLQHRTGTRTGAVLSEKAKRGNHIMKRCFT
jgi:hypothetical protein